VITDEEVEHVRALGVNNEIFMIQNGITPQDFRPLPSRQEMEQLNFTKI